MKYYGKRELEGWMLARLDVGDMADEEIKALQLEATNAMRRIMWDYGIVN